ncbi:MAG: DUF4198 domain-containing protein [Marinobacterium sp.]|nr:DUF4198 domain-containing protein [Marinobacterium sp.]
MKPGTIKKPGAFKKLILTTLLGGTLAAATTASAHPVWMLPGEFNLSSDKAEWVSIDATASHSVFAADKGIDLRDLRIVQPDGKSERVGSYFKGHRRSVFDLELDQEGTYKLQIQGQPRVMTFYRIGKRGTEKRGFFDKVEAKNRLPEGAFDAETIQFSRQSLSYITRLAPTSKVLETTGKGFELEAITHPSDIISGEPVKFKLLMNGQPVTNAEVALTPAGTRYRDDRMKTALKADTDGVLNFTPKYAGPYLLTASIEQDSTSPRFDKNVATIFLTFEAQPE